MTLIGVIHNDHFQWLENKSIDGVIHEKSCKLLNSNIFVNKQVNDEIGKKVEESLIQNTSNKYFFDNSNIFIDIKAYIYKCKHGRYKFKIKRNIKRSIN